MFDSLWTHLNIATLAKGSGYGIIEGGAIGIKDGKISYIGPQETLTDAPQKLSPYVYNGQNQWATPGLIDAHTHMVYAGNRADEFEKRLHGLSYADIAKQGGGILATVAATRGANEDALFQLLLKRANTLLREGVTSLEIKSGYGLDLENERKILRVATRLKDESPFFVQRTFLGAHALPPEFKDKDAYINHICRDMLPALARENLVDAVDIFCENIGFPLKQTQHLFKAARDLRLPVKIHAEQLSNMQGAALAAEYGALSADHLEYTDESGVKAMAKSGTIAMLLPGAFYYLREQKIPPIDLFRKYNVPMAVATDHNPGTSPTLSLLLMMNMACTLFHLTPEEALAGVTRNAAQALGCVNDRGTLEKGKSADIALWDIDHPRDLAAAIGVNPCTGVIAGGQYFGF